MPPGSSPYRYYAGALVALGMIALGAGARAQQADAPLLRGDVPPAANAPDEGAEGATPDAPPPKKPVAVTMAPKANRTALPPLQSYRHAQRLGEKGGAPDPNASPAAKGRAQVSPGPTVAAIPAPPPVRKFAPPEENAFDPIGLRLGDIVVKPYVEEDVGQNSNPLYAATAPQASLFETTEVGGSWQSDWSRDDFHGQLRGGYTDNIGLSQANTAYGSGTADGRVDVSRDLSFDGEGRFNVADEALSTLGFTSATPNANPYVLASTYGLTGGGVAAFGDLSLGLHGLIDRNAYENVAILGAVHGDLASDDYNDWTAKARASYRISPAVSPFIEIAFDTRRYDSQEDALGYARNSNGETVRAGASLAFSQMLIGEASVGYGARQYQDPRLPNASAPLVDASLVWSPTALTKVAAKASTQLSDSVLAGASADIARSYSLDVEHELRRWLTVGVTGAYATDNYVGLADADSSETFGVKGEYHVSREIVLKASAQRQIFDSNQPNQSYTADIFMLGVRLQR